MAEAGGWECPQAMEDKGLQRDLDHLSSKKEQEEPGDKLCPLAEASRTAEPQEAEAGALA